MEKHKWRINVLLIIIMILVVLVSILAYLYFTKDKTKPIIDPEEKKVKQNQKSIFTEEDYPRIDGSTVTLPLAEAFKANFICSDIKEIELIHNNTYNAYENLINEETDLILVTYPSEEEKELVKQSNVELEMVPIAKDAFVFFVNKENPVNNLSLEQVKDIYSGEIKNWKDVGGNNEKIIAYQRPENTVSQLGMTSLVMKNKKMINSLTEMITQNKSEIVDVISDYNNEKTAIGYSYLYYYKTIYTSDKMKLLSIDEIEPSYENIKNKLYDIQTVYYAVIRKEETEDSNARKLLNAMKSERGQTVVKEAGYVQNY